VLASSEVNRVPCGGVATGVHCASTDSGLVAPAVEYACTAKNQLRDQSMFRL
jgi:hypothetical protein